MATANPFDLLGDDDNDDPSQLIAKEQQKVASPKTLAPTKTTAQQQPKQAKLPSKPLPPAQAVREAKNDTGRGGGRGGGRGLGRGRGGGYNRDSRNNENAYNNGVSGAVEEGDIVKSSDRSDRPRGSYGGPRSFRGGRRGSFSNGEAGDGERPRRPFERHSGTGRGNELKREGSGRGNWGAPTDEGLVLESDELPNANERVSSPEKQPGEEDAAEGNKENPVNEPGEKEPEDKEMTLEEYEKVVEEKRRALQALKADERKVDVKEFESMQQLSKKGNDDIFIKLGSDKDKRKEIADKEERAKKAVSINEFLKPAEGERGYRGGGRGRGRGEGGNRGGHYGGNTMDNVPAPSIQDPGQFPTLGGK